MVDKVVLFCGRMGSGKDYQCQKLVNEQGYKQIAFADALREIAFNSLCVPLELGMAHYDYLKKNDVIKVFCPDNKEETNGYTREFSFRTFLQKLGTEGIRYFDKDFWCRCVVKKLQELPQDTKVCISDMRFINEYEYVYNYCKENEIDFDCIFCDYHSERYGTNQTHASEQLANKLIEYGYTDLQLVEYSIMKQIKDDTQLL